MLADHRNPNPSATYYTLMKPQYKQNDLVTVRGREGLYRVFAPVNGHGVDLHHTASPYRTINTFPVQRLRLVAAFGRTNSSV